MNNNDKISFEELLKSGQLLPDESSSDEKIFKDKPQKRDFTITLLLIIAVLCICGCIYYATNAMLPINPQTTVSGTTVTVHLETVSEQYKNGKVNINTAGIDVLCTLKSIGESKALSIMAYREESGPFGRIEDIKNVSGIGESTFEKIKDDICI